MGNPPPVFNWFTTGLLQTKFIMFINGLRHCTLFSTYLNFINTQNYEYSLQRYNVNVTDVSGRTEDDLLTRQVPALV